jgi:hypothetical protein
MGNAQKVRYPNPSLKAAGTNRSLWIHKCPFEAAVHGDRCNSAHARSTEPSEENELLIQRRLGARKEATMDYEAVEGDYSEGLNQVVAATEFGQALAHSHGHKVFHRVMAALRNDGRQ